MTDWHNPAGLTCTMCGATAFAKLAVEIPRGSATYLVCPKLSCIHAAADRAGANLLNASKKIMPMEQVMSDGAQGKAITVESHD
jgi:hypothetical protein